MLTFVVVDDEPLAREILYGYLKKMDGIDSVKLFGSAIEALRYLENAKADILLLDIEMPEMTGLEFLEKLNDPPFTIFTTAYRNYAFEGFELGVIDFLLKPISFERFCTAIEKIRDFNILKLHNTQLEQDKLTPEFIFVKSGLTKIKLRIDAITHIQGLKDYAIVHTSNEKIVIKGSVKHVQEMLPSSLFTRVHKSFVVANNVMRRVERNRIILGNHQIPIGRNYRGDVDRIIEMS